MPFDPTPIAAGLTVTSIVEAIKAAGAFFEAKQGAKLKDDEATGLVLRLWGSVHHESRRNIERLRRIVATQPSVFVGGSPVWNVDPTPFDFAISSATFPDLCRLAPNPKLLDEISSVLAALRAVAFWQRTASTNFDFFANISSAECMRRLAEEILEQRRVVERFNRVNQLGVDLGEEQFGKLWNADAAFPQMIDPLAPIDESLL
jgi:hypothetical protein